MDVGQAITEGIRSTYWVDVAWLMLLDDGFASGGAVPRDGCMVWTEDGERIVPPRHQ